MSYVYSWFSFGLNTFMNCSSLTVLEISFISHMLKKCHFELPKRIQHCTKKLTYFYLYKYIYNIFPLILQFSEKAHRICKVSSYVPQ